MEAVTTFAIARDIKQSDTNTFLEENARDMFLSGYSMTGLMFFRLENHVFCSDLEAAAQKYLMEKNDDATKAIDLYPFFGSIVVEKKNLDSYMVVVEGNVVENKKRTGEEEFYLHYRNREGKYDFDVFFDVVYRNGKKLLVNRDTRFGDVHFKRIDSLNFFNIRN